jgi:ATP-dependent 26S proteasome regulatory subunit
MTAATPYNSAEEHLRDHLSLVQLFVSRAIRRGRAEGWLEPGAEVSEVTDETLRALFRQLEERTAMTAQMLPLDLMRKRLRLTISEQFVLLTLLAYEFDPRLRRLMSYLSTETTSGLTVGTIQSILYSDAPALGQLELSRGGALHALRMIEIDDVAAPLCLRRIRVLDRVRDLAVGVVRLDRDVETCATLTMEPPRESLVMSEDVQKSVDDLIRAAVTTPASPILVLVGQEGSGRRTLLRRGFVRAGLGVLAVKIADLPGQEREREQCLRACLREALLFDAALVLEDLDKVAEGADQQGIVHAFERAGLSAFPGPVAATMATEQSVRSERGMSWLPLGALRETDRAILWARELSESAEPDLVSDVAQRYQVSGGTIVASAARAVQTARAEGRKLSSDDIHMAVRGHIDLRLAGMGTRVITSQTWDDVVLTEDILAEVQEIIARVKHRRQVYESWGFARKLGRGLGLSALFYGAPGTGKTMVAGLIARELGLDLYQVDLSRIVSKWVGETEKQLANLFSAAETGHAILLFDEADSLFSKRTDVKSANDRYANLEVNYLLQRMEAFAGITVLTTNHDTAIDEAFRRRLAFRIEFPKPDSDERERIWRAVVPAEASVAKDVNFSDLARRYEMTGGYIRNAALRAAFFAASDKSAINAEHLRRAAALEMSSMGKVVSRAHA